MRLPWVGLCLFVLLALTGLGLMVFYAPTMRQAALAGIGHRTITTGGALRGAHFWISQVLGPVILLHLALLLVRGSSVSNAPKPTALVIALFVLTAFLWFTGSLLPWEQVTYWLAKLARQRDVHLSLMQVYWTHVVILPVLTGIVLFFYVRRFREGERSLSRRGVTVE